MSVSVVGSTPNCCGEGCVNSPMNRWARLGAGSFFPIQEGMQISGTIADTDAQLLDQRTDIPASRNFCFSGYLQSLNGSSATVRMGLENTGGTYGVYIGISSGNWALIWFTPGGSTTKNLGIAADANAHYFQVCKVGNTIKAKFGVEGAWATYTIDSFFPSITLFPFAGVNGLVTSRVTDYCVTRS